MNRVALVSLGITKVHINPNRNITCAFEDAQKVYAAFEKVFRDNFSQVNSICLKDVTSYEFEKVLSSLAVSLTREDILFVYFSGHGLKDNSQFYLLFSDAIEENKKGILSTDELKGLLSKFACKIVVVIDACYSGALTSLMNQTALRKSPIVAVIASVNSVLQSHYTDTGSYFTKAFVNAINELNENNQVITLASIEERMDLNYKGHVSLIQDGREIVLKEREDSFSEDYVRDIVQKIQISEMQICEMIWYSISEFPSIKRLEILKQYLEKTDGFNECNWLVRRAIGSVISSLEAIDKKKYELCMTLLQEHNWIYKCIGVIGARYDLNSNPDFVQMYKKIIREGAIRVDPIWLANLYLSELESADGHELLELAISSKLRETSWGIIDIYERFHRRQDVGTSVLRIIEESVTSIEILKPLYLHLYLRNKLIKEDIFDNDLKNNGIFSELYLVRPRGRTIDIRSKWLFSIVYGEWRDQLRINITEYLNNMSQVKIEKELHQCQFLPLAEMRMAIVEFFNGHNEYNSYINCLDWAKTDPHPWVRRKAIELFDAEAVQIDDLDIDNYPGIFDVLIAIRGTSHDVDDIMRQIENYNWSFFEKQSIIRLFETEM